MRFNVVFSGFANDTPWFLFAALLLGRIASKSGLARRLAYSVMLRVGSTYSRILLGLIMTDFILTFIVPSGLARVAILATISLALIEAFQAQKGSNIARGMFLIMTYTGNLFDKMILAGAGSITAAGAMAKFGNVEVLWGPVAVFAYQSGVLVLGYSYGYFEARDLVRIGALLTLAEFLILLLLVPFYWPLIGIY